MNPNDKAAWRAIITERMADYESQQGAVETGPATIEDYVQALQQVEPRVSVDHYNTDRAETHKNR